MYYSPKKLKKFLPSIICLGIFVTFLITNVFTGGGILTTGVNAITIFKGLRALILVGAACAGLIVIKNETVHKILFAIVGFYAVISTSGYFVTVAGTLFDAYNGFYAFTLILEDVISLGMIALAVLIVLRLLLKNAKALDTIINIVLIATAGMMVFTFIMQVIGAIVVASENTYAHTDVLWHSPFTVILMLPVLAFTFFNLDELGISNIFMKKKQQAEQPAQVEQQQPVQEEVKEEPKEEVQQ